MEYCKEYIEYIISALSTKKNIIDGVNERKKFTITEKDQQRYGMEKIISTLKYLETVPEISISIKWVTFGGRTVSADSFKILKSNINELCSIIGRTAPSAVLDTISKTMDKYTDKCRDTWLFPYYEECIEKVRRGTFPPYWDDTNFHNGLLALAKNEEDEYYPTFSINTYGNSKTFTRDYKDKYISIIRKFHPLAVEDMDDDEILKLCKLYSYNIYFEIKGDITFTLKGSSKVYDMSDLRTGLVFNTATIDEIDNITIPDTVKAVMTIENKANFVAQDYRKDILFIYAHGFLSPSEKRVCEKIYCNHPDIKYLHWSDMDFGGIRIFQFMKNNVFPTVTPYRMGKEDYMKMLEMNRGYEIKKSTLKQLELYNAEELSELKNCILNHGIGIEQEDYLHLYPDINI